MIPEQLWSIINMVVGAGLAIAGGWFAHKRAMLLEVQKRNWELEDLYRNHRFQIKERRLRQAEELAETSTSRIYQIRDTLLAALDSKDAGRALSEFEALTHDLLNPSDRSFYTRPAVIHSIGDETLVDIWKKISANDDKARSIAAAVMRVFEKNGNQQGDPFSLAEYFVQKRDEFLTLLQVRINLLVDFYQAIDRLRGEWEEFAR